MARGLVCSIGDMGPIKFEKKDDLGLALTFFMAQGFDIWCVALSCGPLPRLFKQYPWGQKWPHPRGNLFHTD